MTFPTALPATDGLIVWSDEGRWRTPPFVTAVILHGGRPAVAELCSVLVMPGPELAWTPALLGRAAL